MKMEVRRVPRNLRRRRKAVAQIRRLVARCATLSDFARGIQAHPECAVPKTT